MSSSSIEKCKKTSIRFDSYGGEAIYISMENSCAATGFMAKKINLYYDIISIDVKTGKESDGYYKLFIEVPGGSLVELKGERSSKDVTWSLDYGSEDRFGSMEVDAEFAKTLLQTLLARAKESSNVKVHRAVNVQRKFPNFSKTISFRAKMKTLQWQD